MAAAKGLARWDMGQAVGLLGRPSGPDICGPTPRCGGRRGRDEALGYGAGRARFVALRSLRVFVQGALHQPDAAALRVPHL